VLSYGVSVAVPAKCHSASSRIAQKAFLAAQLEDGLQKTIAVSINALARSEIFASGAKTPVFRGSIGTG
jgi:hypothetical protein